MKLYKKVPMKFQDKEYEIRILYQGKLINIATFFNNHPVNGFRYQIQIPKQFDIRKILKTEVIKILIQKAWEDVVENRWEKLLKQAHY